MIQRTFIIAGLLLSVATGLTEQDVINKTFNVKPGGTLAVAVDRGSIKVLTADADKVEIEVVRELRRASAEDAQEIFEKHQIEFSQDGDTVRIEADSNGLSALQRAFNGLRVEYTVTVPARFDVDLRTSGGNIAVTDLDGTVKAQTTGGSMDIGTITGEIQARTSGGNIKIGGGKKNVQVQTTGGSVMIGKVDGDLKAKTSGGNITVDAVKGEIEAGTTGGSIKIASAGKSVKATTSGGNISAELAEGASGQCTVRTTGGSVKLMLPENVAADLNASTTGGRVNSDFEGEFNKQRTKLVAKLNGGGPEMRVSTSGGNVDIRKK